RSSALGSSRFPYTTLFRSRADPAGGWHAGDRQPGRCGFPGAGHAAAGGKERAIVKVMIVDDQELMRRGLAMVIGSQPDLELVAEDRKSTRLNSSHVSISYA